MKKRTLITGLLGCAIAGCFSAHAATITFYYTTLSNPDVFANTYNTVTNQLVGGTAIGFSQQGADGIEPGSLVGANRTVYFTGETDQTIFQIPVTGGAVVSSGNAGITAFLLAENPQATSLFTFDNLGHISTLPLDAQGKISGNGTVHNVTGNDINVSELVWGMNPIGPVFYMTGAPGSANGNFGTIDPTTFVTTRLFTGITTTEDAHFDPFTGLILLFGQGQLATLNPVTLALSAPISLPGGTCGASTLTTGAVDGAGHALITDCGTLSYIDYSASHNILTSSVVAIPGVFPGKDIAIFSTSVPSPEPSTIAFALSGLAVVAFRRFRRA